MKQTKTNIVATEKKTEVFVRHCATKASEIESYKQYLDFFINTCSFKGLL